MADDAFAAFIDRMRAHGWPLHSAGLTERYTEHTVAGFVLEPDASPEVIRATFHWLGTQPGITNLWIPRFGYDLLAERPFPLASMDWSNRPDLHLLPSSGTSRPQSLLHDLEPTLRLATLHGICPVRYDLEDAASRGRMEAEVWLAQQARAGQTGVWWNVRTEAVGEPDSPEGVVIVELSVRRARGPDAQPV
jgi:hypothetical protein